MYRKTYMIACSIALFASVGFYWRQHKNNSAAYRDMPFIRNIANGASMTGEEMLDVAFDADDLKNNALPRLQLRIDNQDSETSMPEIHSDQESREKFVRFIIHTDDYDNGPHTLRVNDAKGRTDVRKVKFYNTLYRIKYDEEFNSNPNAPNAVSFSASLASKQIWTIMVQSSYGKNEVVRMFRGNSNAIRVKWDGRDADGKMVPSGNYDFVVHLAGEKDRVYNTHKSSR